MVRRTGEDFIYVEGVAIAPVLAFCNIAMAEIETIVKQDCVADDVGRESVTLICIYPEIVSQGPLIWQYRNICCELLLFEQK